MQAGVEAEPVSKQVASALPHASERRLAYIDILRGLAMILMALDHTRDFFTNIRFAPEDLSLTNGPLFLTRWITHFCAPIFFLLAGTSAYLSLSQGRSRNEVSHFLWTRGLWLVFLNLTVMAFGWTSTFPFYFSDVLWSLGWGMVLLAFLIYLPVRWIAILGAIVIITHNMFDWVNPHSLGRFGALWLILHGYGDFWIAPAKQSFFVLFPLIPWIGVMAVGYSLGPLLRKQDWKHTVFGIGLVLTACFLGLRFFHLYGNGHHRWNGVAGGRWRIEKTLTPARVPLEIERLIHDAHSTVSELTLDHVTLAVGEGVSGLDLHGRAPDRNRGPNCSAAVVRRSMIGTRIFSGYGVMRCRRAIEIQMNPSICTQFRGRELFVDISSDGWTHGGSEVDKLCAHDNDEAAEGHRSHRRAHAHE